MRADEAGDRANSGSRAMWNQKGDLKRLQRRQAAVFRGQTAVSRSDNRGRQSCNRGTRIQRRLNRRQM
jgi:hypothetical protein